MPQGDKSKKDSFILWKQGKSISEIKKATTAKHNMTSLLNLLRSYGLD